MMLTPAIERVLILTIKITAAIFLYMGLFGHSKPAFPLDGPIAQKDISGIKTMMLHSLKIGALVFLYLGFFGTRFPTIPPSGPFCK
jgi:hypothetical protein